MTCRKLGSLLVLALAMSAAVVGASSGLAAPVTKQNGAAALEPFTSICGVDGYASYGRCGGDTTTFANVAGRVAVVQAKAGRYNLGFAFANLTPGESYTLWGNNGVFFPIGTTVANIAGVAQFSYQTTAPVGLGFDLNFTDPNVTLVTSYWTGRLLARNADGTLYAQ